LSKRESQFLASTPTKTKKAARRIRVESPLLPYGMRGCLICDGAFAPRQPPFDCFVEVANWWSKRAAPREPQAVDSISPELLILVVRRVYLLSQASPPDTLLLTNSWRWITYPTEPPQMLIFIEDSQG